jgi:hypothetical protein
MQAPPSPCGVAPQRAHDIRSLRVILKLLWGDFFGRGYLRQLQEPPWDNTKCWTHLWVIGVILRGAPWDNPLSSYLHQPHANAQPYAGTPKGESKLTSPPPDPLTRTRELNPCLPFWLQAFPCCHGAPSRRPWYEAHFVWMPCMKGHVMNHVVNTPTIYLLRFAQNSNVTTYKDGQKESFTIILLLLCPMLHFFWVWWANQSDSL